MRRNFESSLLRRKLVVPGLDVGVEGFVWTCVAELYGERCRDEGRRLERLRTSPLQWYPEQAAARQSCLKKPSAIQLMGSLRSNHNHSE